MHVLCVVPIRSGSRGLPGKNIRPLLGKPLVWYAVKPALDANMVDRVIVSTDTEEYARVARSCGAEVPWLRPAPLAEDVPSEQVIQHAVEHVEPRPDIVVTLQCTTPFLTPQNVNELVRQVEPFGRFDSSVTVCEVKDHPAWVFHRRGDGSLEPLLPGSIGGSRGVRQSLPTYYRLNGAGYATTVKALMRDHRILAGRMGAVIMPPERSHDVDTEEDFRVVEALKREAQE